MVDDRQHAGGHGRRDLSRQQAYDRSSENRRLLRIHELGHALGYLHVTKRTSIMNPAIGPAPTEFDRHAAMIAFERMPGNLSPDSDVADAPRSPGGSSAAAESPARRLGAARHLRSLSARSRALDTACRDLFIICELYGAAPADRLRADDSAGDLRVGDAAYGVPIAAEIEPPAAAASSSPRSTRRSIGSNATAWCRRRSASRRPSAAAARSDFFRSRRRACGR